MDASEEFVGAVVELFEGRLKVSHRFRGAAARGETCFVACCELLAGQLTLQIPLEVGGADFEEAASGISTVADGCLNIVIPDWLAAKLGIVDGSIVAIDNHGGKLNLSLVPDHDPEQAG